MPSRPRAARGCPRARTGPAAWRVLADGTGGYVLDEVRGAAPVRHRRPRRRRRPRPAARAGPARTGPGASPCWPAAPAATSSMPPAGSSGSRSATTRARRRPTGARLGRLGRRPGGGDHPVRARAATSWTGSAGSTGSASAAPRCPRRRAAGRTGRAGTWCGGSRSAGATGGAGCSTRSGALHPFRTRGHAPAKPNAGPSWPGRRPGARRRCLIRLARTRAASATMSVRCRSNPVIPSR